jgi:ferredoxin
VTIVEGADLLEPPREDELDVLDVFGDDPRTTRLACQVRVKESAGAGTVRVRKAE